MRGSMDLPPFRIIESFYLDDVSSTRSGHQCRGASVFRNRSLAAAYYLEKPTKRDSAIEIENSQKHTFSEFCFDSSGSVVVSVGCSIEETDVLYSVLAIVYTKDRRRKSVSRVRAEKKIIQNI